MKNLHPLLQEYVSQVCKQVKARELRQEISEEISAHLYELWETKRVEGLDDEAAARQAIAQMGDTDSVANGLNRVHRPRVPWMMLFSLALLLTIALLAMYAVQLSYQAGEGLWYGTDFFGKQAVFMGIGLAILFLLSRIHYQNLNNYSWILYGLAVVLILIANQVGPQVNGARVFVISGLSPTAICPYMFIVAAAGFLSRGYARRRTALWQLIILGIIPLLLFAAIPSFPSLLLYSVTFALMLFFSRYGWRWVIAYLSMVASIFVLPLLLSGLGQKRLIAFLRPQEDAEGSGYIYLQIEEAVRSAGWRGHGFGSSLQELPSIHSDSVFTYLIYSLGWMFGIIVLISILLFLFQLVKAAMSVRDAYGKMLISGLGALLAVQFAWSIGMSLGILPISAVSFPLISYGGSGLLSQLAAIGLIYSVYRLKDMIRIS